VYISVCAKHINLGFYWGAQMDDPEGVLEGSGKQLRHIRISSQADLGTPIVRAYLRWALPMALCDPRPQKRKSILAGALPKRRNPRKNAVDHSSKSPSACPVRLPRASGQNLLMAGWECHHCKQWIERGEAHDCWTTTEAALTRDLTEDLREAWERLRETAAGFGQQRIYASGHAIMFARKTCYFFVRPRKRFLEVCVFLGRTIEACQVRRVDRVSKSKLVHIIRIAHRDEVEAPVTDWLREAYEVSDVLSKGDAASKTNVRSYKNAGRSRP